MNHYTKDLPGTEILIGLIATKNTGWWSAGVVVSGAPRWRECTS